MTNYLKVKATITNIEPCLDKNDNRYFRLNVRWNDQDRTCYAFSTDYSLKETTRQTLTNAPENLLNRLTLITYEELANQMSNNTFIRIKEIEIVY
jgi:hypothetical protein